jgi:hypothetical protein
MARPSWERPLALPPRCARQTSPLTYKAIFSTSLICTRNSTSSTTRPATQKPIAAPRCLSQAAPSPRANRGKGKLIMAQPLQGQPLALAIMSDRQLERITTCITLAAHAPAAAGAAPPVESRRAVSAPSIAGRLLDREVVFCSVSEVTDVELKVVASASVTAGVTKLQLQVFMKVAAPHGQLWRLY